MTQNTDIAVINNFETAKADAVINSQPVLLPSYKANGVPVSIVIYQEFDKDETQSFKVQRPVYELDEAGNAIFDLIPAEGITDGKGNQLFNSVLRQAKDRKGKPEFKLCSYSHKTGAKIPVKFAKTICFMASDGNDFRKKLGEGLNEFRQYLEGGGKVAAKSKPLHLTLKVNGAIISTTSLQDGGVKLSKCFEKSIFSTSLFASEFCKPIFKQLKKVAELNSGKPAKVDGLILSALK